MLQQQVILLPSRVKEVIEGMHVAKRVLRHYDASVGTLSEAVW